MNKWISVNDALPKTVGYSVDYLVCLQNGDMAVTSWMNIGEWGWDPESPITHWVSLPESPEEITTPNSP